MSEATKHIDDGGQAFPQNPEWLSNRGGMTLRDYFAAKALQALIPDECQRMKYDGSERTGFDDSPSDSSRTFAEQIARECYYIADAMLAARKAVQP